MGFQTVYKDSNFIPFSSYLFSFLSNGIVSEIHQQGLILNKPWFKHCCLKALICDCTVNECTKQILRSCGVSVHVTRGHGLTVSLFLGLFPGKWNSFNKVWELCLWCRRQPWQEDAHSADHDRKMFAFVYLLVCGPRQYSWRPDFLSSEAWEEEAV